MMVRGPLDLSDVGRTPFVAPTFSLRGRETALLLEVVATSNPELL